MDWSIGNLPLVTSQRIILLPIVPVNCQQFGGPHEFLFYSSGISANSILPSLFYDIFIFLNFILHLTTVLSPFSCTPFPPHKLILHWLLFMSKSFHGESSKSDTLKWGRTKPLPALRLSMASHHREWLQQASSCTSGRSWSYYLGSLDSPSFTTIFQTWRT